MSLGRCSECGAATTRSPTLAGEDHWDVAPGSLHWHALLNTNDPPLATELPFIQSIRAKTRTRLNFLDDEIARLWDRLGELEGERTSLAKYHPQLTRILSPLRRMPPEILAEIFSWTLPSLPEAMHRSDNRFTIQESPWLLTHVSRRWRAVSISTPELWSLIALDYLEGSTYPLAAVKAQIERARMLKIHFHGDNLTESAPQIEMFRCLIEHASRWEELDLNLTSDLVPLLPLLRDRILSLRRLWIQWESDISMESIDYFSTTTSLLEVGVSRQSYHVAIPFPAHQLTSYHVVAPWETHRGILKQSQKLVTAHIDIFRVAGEEIYREIIELIHLRRLFVSEIQILNCLKATVLEEMAVYLEENRDHSDLNTFIARSAPNLRSFCLQGRPTVDATTEILQKCASITEIALEIYYYRGVGDYFSTLLPHLTLPPPDGHRPLSPHMSRISIWLADEPAFDYAAYLAMLRSRWNAGSGALKATALLVTTGIHAEPAVVSGLEDLRRDGLDISTLERGEVIKTMRAWDFKPQWI